MMNDTVPYVNFCGVQVTRFILGDNPFTGNSYIKDIHSGDEMMSYYTAEKCVLALFEAEKNGINTFLALGDPFIIRVIRQYRNEGGKMNIMFQNYPPVDFEVNVRQMMTCNPIAIYHTGSSLDYLFEKNKTDEIHNRLKIIRSTGVITGMGTHVPETLLQAEQEKWDVDFYSTCLYNARKTLRGQQSGFITGKPKELVFYHDDRLLMFDAIRKISKPCIAFKVFAGGQIFSGKSSDEIPAIAEFALREAYKNIKPNDIICAGAFQKTQNEIMINTNMVKKILSN